MTATPPEATPPFATAGVQPTDPSATPPSADAGAASSATALPPAEPSSPSPAAPRLAVGAPVEFQTTDPITLQHIRGFGIVRGHQVDVDGAPLTLVAPLPQGVLLVTDDEILPGD